MPSRLFNTWFDWVSQVQELPEHFGKLESSTGLLVVWLQWAAS